jgi:hypothetical protein
VPDRAGPAVDDHHPGVVATGERVLSDELGREIVVEVGDAKGLARCHGRSRDALSP